MSSTPRKPRWYPALGGSQPAPEAPAAGESQGETLAAPVSAPSAAGATPAALAASADSGWTGAPASGPDADLPADDRSGLAREIGKLRPFDLPEQETYLNILRTAAIFGADFNHLFKQHGLTEATYNALRILRGGMDDPAAPYGRTCSQVGEHMIAQVPDVTRLVDRLEQQGLAERRRCARDRRVVYVAITPKGLDVLAGLDEPVLALHRAHLGHMSADELETLSRLLTKSRLSKRSDKPGDDTAETGLSI